MNVVDDDEVEPALALEAARAGGKLRDGWGDGTGRSTRVGRANDADAAVAGGAAKTATDRAVTGVQGFLKGG